MMKKISKDSIIEGLKKDMAVRDGLIASMEKKREKSAVKMAIIIYCVVLGAVILSGALQGIVSEVNDNLELPNVLDNVGSHICNNYGQRFVDWEDNELECGDMIIDFNKPVMIRPAGMMRG